MALAIPTGSAHPTQAVLMAEPKKNSLKNRTSTSG